MKETTKLKDLLREARTLAEFSNLSPADVDYFRHNYPDFVPDWWGSAAFSLEEAEKSIPVWKLEQQRLQDAWRTGFPPDTCVQLISDAAKMTELERRLQAMTERLIEPLTGPPLAKEVLPKPIVYPYQRAVMFLAIAPWRAQHCKMCLNRFVAGEPRQQLCSERCRQEAERRRKRGWWMRSGKEWRGSKQKSKSTRRRA